MTARELSGRVILCQPALPAYRLDFFGRLATHFGDRFRTYYSPTDMGALTKAEGPPTWSTAVGLMRPLISGVIEWQPGLLAIPMERGDTLIVCGGPRNLATLALLAKARCRGVRTIWFGHYWSSTTRPYRFYLRMLLMKLAHSVLFYTDGEIAEYRSGFGRNDRRMISAVNNGIEIEPIAAHRRLYRASERPRAILFIGRLIEKSSLETLLEALSLTKFPDVSLHVIGDGPQRLRLESIAAKFKVAHRISWHGGTVQESCIAAVANQCRIFVYPGAVGLSVIHAMGYGIPAVVHGDRWLHMPEVIAVKNGVNGRYFERNSAESLAAVIDDMIDNDDMLDSMSASAREMVDEVYNTREMAKRVIALIDRPGAKST